MMGGMDPRAMKGMLAKMGIKTIDIDASRVIIECGDRNIIIDNPEVTQIEAQGQKSFQIAGAVSEQEKKVIMEVTEDDIKMVMDKTGITDKEKVKQALISTNGDIAQAILDLTG